MIDAKEALTRLRHGNRRFLGQEPLLRRLPQTDAQRRKELIGGQAPFAVVLGCSDSRVPVELVFDQGIGDLFVIRVAGNIAASSQVGSIEYAAQTFGTPLVVVLGHTQCGAVMATVDEVDQPSADPSPNLNAIVKRVRPSVMEATETQHGLPKASLLGEAVRANVRASVHKLRDGSAVLAARVAEGKLLVVGAEYSLETGAVEFIYGLPDSGG